MNLLPAGLALTLPAAASAASSVAKRVGQSFQQMMTSAQGNSDQGTSTAAESTTLSDKLSQLAESFRTWLSQHQINSPFELELGSASSLAGKDGVAQGELSVRGTQSTEIRQLLQQNPEQLSQLTKLLSSIQASFPTIAGNSKIQITDLDSSISY